MRPPAFPIAATLSLVIVLGLGACSSPAAAPSGGDEVSSTSESQQSNASADTEGGADLPSGWPSELPAPDGKLMFGVAKPDSVSANFRMEDMDDVERLFADFLSAGYELLAESETNGSVSRGFANETFKVNISVSPDGDRFSLNYVAVPA